MNAKLKEDSFGIARYINKYDEKGNEILTETYGADEKLKENSYNDRAREVKKYDESCIKAGKKGDECIALKETFGADGRLKERIITKYDTKGYKISSTTFSSSGAVVKMELSPVFHHPSIPDKIFQLTTDEYLRPVKLRIQAVKKN